MVLIFASCCILTECGEVDERRPLLHDETDGEGEHFLILIVLS